jgi:hypothetical protein
MAEIFNSPAGDEITRATEDAISAAAHANVNFFTLDPRGLIGMTTDFIEMTRNGPPDYAGADFSKPLGTPHSGVQALLGEIPSHPGQPARISGGHRRLCGGGLEFRGRRVRTHRARQQPVLPAWVHATESSAQRPVPSNSGDRQTSRAEGGGEAGLPFAERPDGRRAEAR